MLGLGLIAGAVCYAPVCAAQQPPESVPPPSQPPPPLDTGGVDTSGVARGAHADSIKALYHPDTTRSRAPLAHAPVPQLLEPGENYRWDRAQLQSMGIQTMADLLSRVPGFTGFAAGWISTPMNGAYLGDIARVRVFYDGIELDALNNRLRGNQDLATIQLWTLEEVTVERGASELRVYCRSWRANRVTPYSQADVLTGNESTNLYRAYYGQRFGSGEAVQVGATQFNNTGQFGGGGSESSIMVRLGYASGGWSINGFAMRTTRGMDQLQSSDPFLPTTFIPDLESQRTDAYFRVAYGDPDHGRPWFQAIASSMAFKNTSPIGTQQLVTDTTQLFVAPTATQRIDSVSSESQYVLSGGMTLLGLHLSAADRYRVFGSIANYNTGELRASFDNPVLGASFFVQLNGFTDGRADTSAVASLAPTLFDEEELTVRFSPLPFVRFVGTASRWTPKNLVTNPEPTSTTARLEAGLRLHQGLWLTGGVIRQQDTTVEAAPTVYDTTMQVARIGPSTGIVASLRGRLWRSIYVDMSGIDWNSAQPYRPQYEGRAEAYFQTEWLSHFPRHTFAIKAGGAFDYRSATIFPATSAPNGAFYTVGDTRVYTLLAEIRILQGTLTWQLRNASGYPYFLVPGYQNAAAGQYLWVALVLLELTRSLCRHNLAAWLLYGA